MIKYLSMKDLIREFDRRSNVYKDMRNRKIGINEKYLENIPTPTKKKYDSPSEVRESPKDTFQT